jgi:Holliday junction resolvasome RuvABC endonuclease subunit
VRVPKSSKGLTAERIRQLAVGGAEALLKQLRAEVVAIERTFPELSLPARRRALQQSVKTAQTRTRQMSAAARKAVSARMKKYWAERRKAKAGK